MLQNSSSLLEVVQLAFKLVELLQLISDMETSWINLGSVYILSSSTVSASVTIYISNEVKRSNWTKCTTWLNWFTLKFKVFEIFWPFGLRQQIEIDCAFLVFNFLRWFDYLAGWALITWTNIAWLCHLCSSPIEGSLPTVVTSTRWERLLNYISLTVLLNLAFQLFKLAVNFVCLKNWG